MEREKQFIMVFGVFLIFKVFLISFLLFFFFQSMLYMLLPLLGVINSTWWNLMFIIIHKFCWFLFLSYLLFFLYFFLPLLLMSWLALVVYNRDCVTLAITSGQFCHAILKRWPLMLQQFIRPCVYIFNLFFF